MTHDLDEANLIYANYCVHEVDRLHAEHLARYLCRSRDTVTVNTVICLQSPSEHSDRLVLANAPGDFVVDMGFDDLWFLGWFRH